MKDKTMTDLSLFAQPYNIDATGFYFSDQETFDEKVDGLTDAFGQPVEEFEIQFIDGPDFAPELAKAWGLDQTNFADFIDAVERYDEQDFIAAIILLGENIVHSADDLDHSPSMGDLTLYCETTYTELAEQMVDEGLFGDIPDHLANYIDYEAIGSDLKHDYSEIEINGANYIYRAD